MKRKKSEKIFVPSAECAEIYRDVFSHLAHELGGISSALGLRADALSSVVPAADHLALRGLSDQLRDMNRLLRLLQSQPGTPLMAPKRPNTAADWWALTARTVGAALPRGVLVEADVDDIELPPTSATVLTHLLLLAARDRVSSGLTPPARLRVRVAPDVATPDTVIVTADLQESGELDDHNSLLATRWQRYAARLARRNHAALTWWHSNENQKRWQCALPSTAH